METISNFVSILRWPPSLSLYHGKTTPKPKETTEKEWNCRVDTSTRFFTILQSILLWENSVNSISVVIVFNVLFWGIVVLEVRGFAAASSAALVVVLCYSSLEAQTKDETEEKSPASQAKAGQIDKFVGRARSTLRNLKQLRNDQPGGFCAAVCTVSLGLWLIGRAFNGVLLAYTICMGILVGPALLMRIPCTVLPPKEWDSEIEEFLPAATEDNLQVLKRAGETGDHSSTPTGALEAQIDPFNEDELVGLKMPSHEEGSTDDLELSELELITGETETDGIRFQSGHFERGSSSEEEAELQPEEPKLPSHSDDSDSDFEIIDSRELRDVV
ncbi:uncharacterized protein LOC107273271 [Cephus cinctus]|uniref:Uncharacterized protein LOC107273271 n=1 Tax=Cephus cinctus TaxID=211228 RepID=A0AAJ7CCG4_CEPCN|nr:uncharacterized protein LOC107273271 [Cephus cinctus]